jgi:SAM-dependent methyltransferase
VRGFIDSHYRHQGQIDWQYLDGTDYVICDCANCGLIYQKNIPNELMLDKIYNVMIGPTFLHELEANRLTIDNFERIAGELGLLFRIIDKAPTQVRFLDYGFGHGRWARVAVAMGAEVFATEISPEKVAYANKIGVEIVSPKTLSDMHFDIIHTEQVFEHLTEPKQDFQMLAKALSEDGIMKVAVPPQGNIRSLLKTDGLINWSPQERMWNPSCHAPHGSKYDNYIAILPLEHLNAYSSNSIAILAEEHNMRFLGRVRRQSVPLCTLNATLLTRSLLQLSKEAVRPVFRRDSGYYTLALKASSVAAARC